MATSPRATGGRGQTLLRVLHVIRELSRSPWHLPALGDHLGVAWRTLYRDVQTIEAAGIAVERSAEGPSRSSGRVLYRIRRDTLRGVLGI